MTYYCMLTIWSVKDDNKALFATGVNESRSWILTVSHFNIKILKVLLNESKQ
jgi:hypothetical protein